MSAGQAQRHNFHERVDRGKGVIAKWLTADVSIAAQGRLEFAMDQLAQLPRQDWTRPHASAMGNHTYVIRFREVGGGQLRIFGHFSAHHSAFVMTFNGYEKDDVYHPSDYEQRTVRYKDACAKEPRKFSVSYRDQCMPCAQEL